MQERMILLNRGTALPPLSRHVHEICVNGKTLAKGSHIVSIP
jgi:hypothetical protein